MQVLVKIENDKEVWNLTLSEDEMIKLTIDLIKSTGFPAPPEVTLLSMLVVSDEYLAMKNDIFLKRAPLLASIIQQKRKISPIHTP